MGDFGTWGWKGIEVRALEFPAGQNEDVSPTDRARIRYNNNAKVLEASIDGGPYGPLEASSQALSQTDFFIDPLNGNDDNSGLTADSALASLQEYADRVGHGVVSVFQTVNILNDVTIDSALELRASYAVGVQFIGTQTVLRSGTFTGVQQWDPATDQDLQLTDVAVGTWNGDLLDAIVLTSGPNAGALGFVASDLGGGDTCRATGFWDSVGFVQVDTAIGETYDVVSQTNIDGIIVFAGSGFIQLFNLSFSTPFFFPSIVIQSSQVQFVECQLLGNGGGFGPLFWEASESFGVIAGCHLAAGSNQIDVWVFVSSVLFTGNNGLKVGNGGRVVVSNSGDCLCQGVGAGPIVDSGGALLLSAGSSIAVFDMPGAGDIAFSVQPGATAQISGRLWGQDNDGAGAIGLLVQSAANVLYATDATLRFGFAGATLVESIIAGDSNTYAAIQAATGTTGANAQRNACVAPLS